MNPKATFAIKLSFATVGLIAIVALAATGKAQAQDVAEYIKWVSVTLVAGTALIGASSGASQKETP